MKISTALRLRLLRWAQRVMTARPPDMVERRNTSFDRWCVGPDNKWCAVYLNHFLSSDQPPDVLHDHNYANISIVLDGGYYEHGIKSTVWLKPGNVLFRRAATPHRVELTADAPAISLFFCGPRIHVPKRATRANWS